MGQYSPLFGPVHNLLSGLQEAAARLEDMNSGPWQPAVDIYEREDSFVVIVDLPGVRKKDIEVSVQQNVLKISGVRQKKVPEGTTHVHQMEIPDGAFARFLRLPSSASIEAIDAEFKDGYLTVTIPRGAA